MRGVWLIAFALLFSRTAANAVESAPAVSERATVSLVSEADSYRPGQDVRVGRTSASRRGGTSTGGIPVTPAAHPRSPGRCRQAPGRMTSPGPPPGARRKDR